MIQIAGYTDGAVQGYYEEEELDLPRLAWRIEGSPMGDYEGFTLYRYRVLQTEVPPLADPEWREGDSFYWLGYHCRVEGRERPLTMLYRGKAHRPVLHIRIFLPEGPFDEGLVRFTHFTDSFGALSVLLKALKSGAAWPAAFEALAAHRQAQLENLFPKPEGP